MADEGTAISHQEPRTPDAGELTYEGHYFTPAVDIYETPTEMVLIADMPGVEPGDLDVDLKDDVLTIVGRVTQTNDEGVALLSEYRSGSFHRDFRITDMVNRAEINATLTDGVLTLVLPKAEKVVPRKIPISAR